MNENFFINWNAMMPHIVLVTAAFFLLFLAVIYRVRGSDGGPAAAGALVSVVALGISAYMSATQWGVLCDSLNGFFHVDPYTTFFSLVIIGGAILSVLLSVREAGSLRAVGGEYYALMIIATFAMLVMVSATDLLTIFIGLETMSIAVYVLVGSRRELVRSNEGALKYFLIGAFASAFLIYGIALLFGASGTTRLDGIAGVLGNGTPDRLELLGLGMVLIGFLFKVAAVPFHMWAPDAYEGAPTPVTAFMAAAVKTAAFAVLVRILVGAMGPLAGYWLPIAWVIAVLSMTVGNLAAIFQGSIKRMLAYSSVAHAGYLLVAVASIDPLAAGPDARAVPALLYYLAAYTLMNIGAFGVLIYMDSRDHPMETLEQVRGSGYRYPLLGVAMGVFMFSLAGVPPTAGFMGKFYVFSAAMDQGLVGLVVIAVLNSAVSVYYYIRVVVQMYMRESEEKLPELSFSFPLSLAIAVSVWGIFHLGILPSQVLDLAGRAVLFLR